MVVYGSKVGPNFPPDPDFFVRIAVTSLIFNIFAPDFFKPTLLALESSKISKILPEIKNGPSYPPSEVVVSPKSGVQNLDFTISSSKNDYSQ